MIIYYYFIMQLLIIDIIDYEWIIWKWNILLIQNIVSALLISCRVYYLIIKMTFFKISIILIHIFHVVFVEFFFLDF